MLATNLAFSLSKVFFRITRFTSENIISNVNIQTSFGWRGFTKRKIDELLRQKDRWKITNKGHRVLVK